MTNTGQEAGLLFGGCGGVYFLAEPGELVVEVEKRDRNHRSTPAELRAILVGPDRQVLQEVSIPDDGQAKGSGMGPPQKARLSTDVKRKGVYALNVTVSQDRYGQEMVWGFRTNCPKYIIETARGHKDEPHQEPIVLASPGRPADVCFLPRRGEMTVEVLGLAKDAKALEMYDGKGALVAALQVDPKGQAAHTFPANVHRDAMPWRLHLPSAQAVIHIDSVTRWDPTDLYRDLCCWSPDPASWFPFLEHRWLLTPYRRTIYGKPGETGKAAFQVHNSLVKEKAVELAVEFPDGEWPARVSDARVTVGPRAAMPVMVEYTVPPDGETRSCHIRATPADAAAFSTYSTLIVKGGEAPAARPLQMPLTLKPYQHENEQFGYLPDYPVESQMYFDAQNRPFSLTGGRVAALRDGQWTDTDLTPAVKSRVPPFEGDGFRPASGKIAFDGDNDMYLIARCGGTAALLHSTDGGQTFCAYAIPGRPGVFDIEQFSGHNAPDGPPPFVRFTLTARDPKLIWRHINDLELFAPKKANGRIEIGEPILVSKQCIGLAAHSGIPSSVVSRGAKVHVTWGEATDPEEKVPGVPTYVATYDRQTGQLGKPALVGYGPPANDVHNSPSITMDGQGYLHVLVGTHGRPFPYTRSLQPNDAQAGWTEAALAGEDLSQTYVGFVCGKDDTLYTVFRLWRTGEPFPRSSHATLACMRKRPGQPWEPPKILVVAPFSEYSVYYHRLTIDRKGRLFLSYDCWSTHWFYRNDQFGRRRAVLMSPDGGETWKLAATEDMR